MFKDQGLVLNEQLEEGEDSKGFDNVNVKNGKSYCHFCEYSF